MEYKWIAQDDDGAIGLFKDKPVDTEEGFWLRHGVYTLEQQDLGRGHFLTNWRDSLINLEIHDYKIEDGILMRVEKEYKKIMGRDMQFKNIYGEWVDCESHYEFRMKPKTKTVRFRNYLNNNGYPDVATSEDIEYDLSFTKWIGDWQEIEIEQ